MKALSIFDHYPKSLIFVPSERMKKFWKEHESIDKHKKRLD